MQPPPGWYQDPSDAAELRWWDGASWEPKAPPVALPTFPSLARDALEEQTPSHPRQGRFFNLALVFWVVPLLQFAVAVTLAIALGRHYRTRYDLLAADLASVAFAVYLAIVDRRDLLAKGESIRSGLIWWNLLSPVVYLTARSIRLRGHARGSWTGLACLVAVQAAVIVIIAPAVASVKGPLITSTTLSSSKLSLRVTPTPTNALPVATPTLTTTPSSVATSSSLVTDWYAAGQAAAIRAASTPNFNDSGNSGAPGGIAQNAQQWCADLMFNQQPADLSDYLHSNLPPSSDTQALQEWVAGCESDAPAGLGEANPTTPPIPSFCKFHVVWQDTGQYLDIVEALDRTLGSCHDQAARLTSNSQANSLGTFIATFVVKLTSAPSGWCSLDGVTLTDASQGQFIGCGWLQDNINWLVTP